MASVKVSKERLRKLSNKVKWLRSRKVKGILTVMKGRGMLTVAEVEGETMVTKGKVLATGIKGKGEPTVIKSRGYGYSYEGQGRGTWSQMSCNWQRLRSRRSRVRMGNCATSPPPM